MRRVMMTPTFAAGLGVVVAAVLAYPMARTVFRYNTPHGRHCQLKGCGVSAQGNVPALASAKPGLPLVHPSTHSPEPRAPDEGAKKPSSPASADQPVLGYQTLHQAKTVFVAAITVTSPSSPASGRWQLTFTYPRATILNVWGGTLISSSPHVVVVRAPGSQPGQAGPQGPHILVEVSGRARPPADGTFDGLPCRVVVDTGPGSSH